jgi:hypothetical protein
VNCGRVKIVLQLRNFTGDSKNPILRVINQTGLYGNPYTYHMSIKDYTPLEGIDSPNVRGL